MSVTIMPYQISAVAWFAELRRDLPDVVVVDVAREEDWRDAAILLCEEPTIAVLEPPDPMAYAGCQEWAERFVETVDG